MHSDFSAYQQKVVADQRIDSADRRNLASVEWSNSQAAAQPSGLRKVVQVYDYRENRQTKNRPAERIILPGDDMREVWQTNRQKSGACRTLKCGKFDDITVYRTGVIPVGAENDASTARADGRMRFAKVGVVVA